MSEVVPGGFGMRDDARFPTARSADLIVTASDDELVIYDKAAEHIHQLNKVSMMIWRLCDGQRGVHEIAVAASDELGTEVGEEAVRLALRKFDDAKLLGGSLSADIRDIAQSRRSFMKRAAVGGAAVPMMASISAPAASAAASTCNGDPNNPRMPCPEDIRVVGDCCLGLGVGTTLGKCDASGNCIV